MNLVLDASVALSWCFEDERTDYADSLLDALSEVGAAAPELWAFEVANGLLVAMRKKRIDEDQLTGALEFLHGLPIELSPTPKDRSQGRILELAFESGLSVYDASYLELAERLDLPLASLDLRLRKAAKQLGRLHQPN
ncbi:MAG: type II toxin-antitoxin system VapC family toxin [Planctomycetes bacterium]|nr:type II toxin-antitoxin system VapC family toxin [Planctomycetota bacterium]